MVKSLDLASEVLASRNRIHVQVPYVAHMVGKGHYLSLPPAKPGLLSVKRPRFSFMGSLQLWCAMLSPH